MDWNPTNYAENAGFVSDLGKSVVDLLSPRAGERILDLGCGDGALTSEVARCGCRVVGIDSSPEMVAATKGRGLEAQVVDGQFLRFNSEFDAVFSNAALHWMSDPASVINGVWRALRPGGRFVGELGGYGNVSKIVSAIESALLTRGLAVARPWFFPRPKEYQELLESVGFDVHDIALFPRPTLLPGDIRGWLITFAHPYTSVVPEGERNEFIAEITDSLRNTLVDATGKWIADYVRLRFAATKS